MHTFIRELLEAGGLFLVVFLALHFSIQNFRIDGTSMHPTLIDEQHVIVSKVAYTNVHPMALLNFVPFLEESTWDQSLFTSRQPRFGDIVAISHPKDPSTGLIKRVIGLPGDTIEIQAGKVIRNGEIMREPYVEDNDDRTFKLLEVPEGSYYVLGDNRRVSRDSRTWGFITEDNIIGRAWVSYWPSDRIVWIHGPW